MIEITAFDKEELKKKMKEKEVEHLGEVDNAAHHTTTAFTVEYILANSTGELVFFQELISRTDNVKASKIFECEIIYNAEGKPGFKLNPEHDTLRYIDDYLRNNYGMSRRNK